MDNLAGKVTIKQVGNMVMLDGCLAGTEKEYNNFISQMNEKYKGKMLLNNIIFNKELVITEETVTTPDENKENYLDEVNILYTGMIDIDFVKPTKKFKLDNATNKLKINNVVKVLKVVAPVVLDSDLNIIDGNLRYELAKENNITEIPCLVLNCNGIKADTLRLLLNRASEFQRWNWENVDPFVDSALQIQPLLEPLGFFGTTILPTSYFTNTVVDYVIDPFNEKQRSYKQEEGLAEWAKYRREQMSKLVQEKYAKKDKPTENMVSLFDLVPTEDDLVETYDIDNEVDNIVNKWEKIANDITAEQDKIQKADIEKNGGTWQITNKRNSEDIANEKRENFERLLIRANITDEERQLIKENIADFVDCTTVKLLKEKLSEYTEDN